MFLPAFIQFIVVFDSGIIWVVRIGSMFIFVCGYGYSNEKLLDRN